VSELWVFVADPYQIEFSQLLSDDKMDSYKELIALILFIILFTLLEASM